MVHKHKSFPVGKGGQRKLKQQFSMTENNSYDQSNLPKPDGAAVIGAKGALISFLSILGSNAHDQFSKKGGRKTRIDPLSLKRIADNLLKDIENKNTQNRHESSDEESSDVSDTYQ